MGRILLGVLSILMALGTLLWSWRTVADARASASWPTAQGEVTRSGVERRTSRTRGGGSSVHYEAVVRYRYAVAGRGYESDDIVRGEPRAFADSLAAAADAATRPVGSTPRVFHDPDDPAKATLLPGRAPDGIALLVWTSMVPLLLGGALVVWGVRRRRHVRGGWPGLSDAA